MRDPLIALRDALAAAITAADASSFPVLDSPIRSEVRWSPHVYDPKSETAWHCLSDTPDSDGWRRRMGEAMIKVPSLRLGICAAKDVLFDEAILDAADQMSARIAIADSDAPATKVELRATAADLVYEERLQLSHATGGRILDRWFERCHSAATNDEKGITLEVLTAVMLSQVTGFEVTSRGISNRTQQIDVAIHNRNTSGVLRTGEVVIGEAKNWSSPVGTNEYYALYRKIETRFGRCRLGFFVTTDRFTAGVELERMRDSKDDILVVVLDKDSLSLIWRSGASITMNVEDAVIGASMT